MNSKSPLKVEHNTVSGLFQMEDQEGFPLAFSLAEVVKRGWIVNWGDYFESATEAGWTWRQIEVKVSQAIADSDYPLTFLECCQSVFDTHFHGRVPVLSKERTHGPNP